MNRGTRWLKRAYRRRPDKWRSYSLRRYARAIAGKSDRAAQAWCRIKGLEW